MLHKPDISRVNDRGGSRRLKRVGEHATLNLQGSPIWGTLIESHATL